MQSNSFSDEPTSVQPADVLPNGERMADLPLRSPAQPSLTPASAESIAEEENAEIRQEEARTVRYAIGKLNDFLQWFVAVLEVTLAIRFILMLIGADPTNLFAGFLYSLTNIVLFPFSNIVHTPSIHTNQAFEWPTLIAMAIYWLIFWAVRRFLRILISGPEEVAT